jgi:hypothetical protein
MLDRLAAFIVGEGNWLPLAMGAGFLAAAVNWFTERPAGTPTRRRILAAMNLLTGVMLLVMGVGHLLAVTTKFSQGTLAGTVPLFYLIGLAIVVPAWFLVRHTGAILTGEDAATTVTLNAWMAATLAVLGLVNLPLAVPALCSIGYAMHRRRWTGLAILAVMGIATIGLLVGGLIFMASGQTFEEFSAAQ